MSSEQWHVELLDRQDRPLGALGRVRSLSLEWSIFRSVEGSGTLEVTHDPGVARPPDWRSDRIRISHTDGRGVRRPLGVWVAALPRRSHTAGGLTHESVQLADKASILHQPVGRYMSLDEGTVVTDLITQILAEHGEARHEVQHSPATLPAARLVEPEVTWLELANDLLQVIGYDSLKAGVRGLVGAAPYVDPDSRPITATYGSGAARRMLPDWVDEMDASEVPNIMWITSDGPEDPEPHRASQGFVGYAELTDPADPLSTANRPPIVATEHVATLADQGAADRLARKRLEDKTSVVRRATITHPIDGTQLGGVVEHRPAGFVGAIVQRAIRYGAGAVVEDTVRRIYRSGEVPW